MTDQQQKAIRFAALHVPGDPLILFNIWDAGSAKVVAAAGAKALATGSWSVAAAHGVDDAEAVPLPAVIANLERIAAATNLPVTLDFEGGYAVDPEALAANIALILAAGAIGCNFEDQVVGGEGLHPLPLQVARIRAMRRAAETAGVDAFINARTDYFLKAPADDHAALLNQAIERAMAYADAGASGFFAPGLVAEPLIERLCAASPLPVNIMAFAATPARRLAELGVARISHGPGPYRLAMAALGNAAKGVFG